MNNRRVTVSIIVATYNRPRMLAEALRSVCNQTFGDFECLVVHDAGPHSLALPSDSRFRVLKRELNGGQGASFNTGIDAAEGQFICFLDDDDLFLKDRISIGLSTIRAADISICGSASFSGQVSTDMLSPLKQERTAASWNGDCSSSIRETFTPQLGRAMVRRDKIELFDESFKASADVDWWIRMAKKSQFATSSQIGHLYRRHAGERHNNGKARRVDSLLAIRDKHAAYFHGNPVADAFHLHRAAMCAIQSGQRRRAIELAGKSLRRHYNLRFRLRELRALAGTS